jgi:hypothetical protein
MQVSNLTEIANCVASPPDALVIQNTLAGRSSEIEDIVKSVLKSAPRILFRHEGCVTHHIGSIGTSHIIARVNRSKAEIRHKESGAKHATLNIQGLNCSLDVGGRLYCGTQFKKLLCISSTTFELLGQINMQGSVNSISLGLQPDTIIAGQTNGYISVVKIGSER